MPLLLKTEPSELSVHAMQPVEAWTGVRNAAARNVLQRASLGEQCLLYHSNAGKDTGIHGCATVARLAYSDPTAYTPGSKYYDAAQVHKFGRPIADCDAKWRSIDVALQEVWHRPLLLARLRQVLESKDQRLAEIRMAIEGMQLFKQV